MPGMRYLSLGAVVFDGDCLLVESREWVAVHSARGAVRSTARTAFFANVLAYVHDAPVGLLPVHGKPLMRSAFGQEQGHHASYQRLAHIHDLVHEGRVGVAATYDFKWRTGGGECLDVPVSTAYGAATDLLAMYATALRQHDPLSEFLHYYRVLEAIDGANGKRWVEARLPTLAMHDFGRLFVQPDDPPRRRSRDLFAHYRRQAIRRRDQLVAEGADIAVHLYHNLRCGIAHGKAGVKTFDFGPNVEEVTRDLVLAKMLARMAIDGRVSAPRPTPFGVR